MGTRLTLFGLLLSVPTLGTAQERGPLFLAAGQLVRREMPGSDAEVVLRALLRGPAPAERASGFTTAIPRGTRLVGLEETRGVVGRGVVLTLSKEFARALDHASRDHDLELAIEQIAKTALSCGPWSDVMLAVRDGAGVVRPLDSLLGREEPLERAPPRSGAGPTAIRGALSGKTIAVSPGHGYYWHSTLGWTTQRPLIGGLIEDIHTNEIAMRYIIQYLQNMGARVFSCRDRGEIEREVIGDNDQGASVYRETGAWTKSASTGYNGGSYRFAATSATSTAQATWTLGVPQSGLYPVHVFYRAGTNRTPAARYEVHHAGGVSEVIIDQTVGNMTWNHLGDFWFDGGSNAVVVLDNKSPVPFRVVIADAVRVGAGMGSIARGGSVSRQPRWKECSRYWAQYAGAPSSVWNSTTGEDNSDDVTCRPRFAEWRGADAYISLHTNAGGGTGTSSFIHNTSPTRGSAALQLAVHGQVVGDIRRFYDANWVDRGRKSANFGEVRLLSTMPGLLLELAFHDRDGSKDHDALHDPAFRRIAGRAYARGVMRYFNALAPFPPSRPEGLRITQDGQGGLRVAWDAVAGATGYSIEQSPNGKGFHEVAQTTALSWSTGPLVHGASLSFRLRALNDSGRSFPSDVLTAGTSHDRKAEVLLVAGFDRLGKFVKSPENTRDYLRQHGDAIRRGAEFSLGFDAATNEAVLRGKVALSSYRVVVWALGEESTADETFSDAEQTLVRRYLAGGGRLLVTGSEIGWDLDWRGSAADRAFYRDVLGARYVRDDAQTHAFRGAASGVFQGLAAGTFDNGSGGTYDVDWPDVLAPSDAKSSVCLLYATGSDAAGIQRVDGQSRVVNLGFPLETILDSGLRAEVMRRALRFLLAPRSMEMPSRVAVGGSSPIALELAGEAGNVYVLAASARVQPGIVLPGLGVLPLEPDPLFAVSLGASSGVFDRFAGVLDSQGRGTAQVRIPADPRLRGLRFFISGLTLQLAPPGPATLLPWYLLQVD